MFLFTFDIIWVYSFITLFYEAAIGLCGTVGCSLCPSCDHAAALEDLKDPILGLLFNIPGWVFYVGLGVLVRRAQGLGRGM